MVDPSTTWVAKITKGPFEGAIVEVDSSKDLELMHRVRFVKLECEPLVVKSANLSVGCERAIKKDYVVNLQDALTSIDKVEDTIAAVRPEATSVDPCVVIAGLEPDLADFESQALEHQRQILEQKRDEEIRRRQMEELWQQREEEAAAAKAQDLAEEEEIKKRFAQQRQRVTLMLQRAEEEAGPEVEETYGPGKEEPGTAVANAAIVNAESAAPNDGTNVPLDDSDVPRPGPDTRPSGGGSHPPTSPTQDTCQKLARGMDRPLANDTEEEEAASLGNATNTLIAPEDSSRTSIGAGTGDGARGSSLSSERAAQDLAQAPAAARSASTGPAPVPAASRSSPPAAQAEAPRSARSVPPGSLAASAVPAGKPLVAEAPPPPAPKSAAGGAAGAAGLRGEAASGGEGGRQGGLVWCQRVGCSAQFDPRAEPRCRGTCRHHPAEPVFHDGGKLWPCCGARSHDFATFLAIPGCVRGEHTAEKPEKRASAAPPAAAPVLPSPSPAPVSGSGSASRGTAGRSTSAGHQLACSRCSNGFFCSEHKLEETMHKQAKGYYPRKPAGPAPGVQTEGLAGPAPGVQIEELAGPVEHPAGADVVQTCGRAGCGSKFTERENHSSACRHHSGQPVFHERRKGWSCCRIMVYDFDEFLRLPPCSLGPHRANNPPAPPPPTLPE